MCKENCTENDNNIGFDNDEGGDNYGIDISDKNTIVYHKRGYVPTNVILKII